MVRICAMYVFIISVFLSSLCAPLLAEDCTVTVLPGESIQAAIDAAPEGATLCLAEGEWEEHIRIEKSLTLCGAGAEKTMLRGVEDDRPVVAIYGSDEAETRVALSGIHVGRNADGSGQGLVIGELIRGGAQATIEACTVTGHTTGILLQHHSRVTITGCTVSENSFEGIGVGGNVHVTITDSTVTGNRYGLRFWASPQATISHSTVSGNRLDSILIGHSAQVTISGSTIAGGRSGILISGSAEATILDSMIDDHGSYGVALIEPPCFDTGDLFTGYIIGRGNTGGEIAGGNVCPEDLAFLFTAEGGGLDRRDAVTVQPGESIQAAIDAAPEGAVIRLAEGEWEENLIIEKSLTLRAAGIESDPQAVIRSAREDWPVILIRSQEPIEVTVQGLKIMGAFGADILTGVDIYADGICVHGKATAAIEGNTISGNGRFGILMLSSSQATITSNTISDNGRDGIRMWHSSQAAIEGNTISANGRSGIVMLSSSQVTIASNTITGNREGIGLGGAFHATIASNTIRDNEREGIRMWGSFHATITGNVIRDNDGYGVALWESPCVNTDGVFTGYITGQGNAGGGNAKDDYCPEDLVFLFTAEGGGLDRRE